MTITDLIKELIDSTKERVKTPISGAFLLSFAAYNWRPIAVLLFSNAVIEDRIIVINSEYCNWLAIIGPIIIACGYTIGVPMLMLFIDKLLSKTKSARIAKIYNDKGEIINGKISIARKELELKNIESGNKEIQERIEEIDSLKKQIETHKESIKQIKETNDLTINQLNSSLKEANTRIEEYRNEYNSVKTELKFIKGQGFNLDELLNLYPYLNDVLSELTPIEKISLGQIKFTKGAKTINRSDFPEEFFDKLYRKKIIKEQDGGYSLTNLGHTIIKDIETYKNRGLK